jgi:hypothetical protein
MKKSLLTFWLFSLFLTTNLKAQDCLPETKQSDPTDNAAVAKFLKYFMEDNQTEVMTLTPKGKIKSNYQQATYLRHTFIDDWSTGMTENRNAVVLIVVKTKTGECGFTIQDIQQPSLGAGRWGAINNNGFGDQEYRKKYIKETAPDCDCILKTTDWLK